MQPDAFACWVCSQKSETRHRQNSLRSIKTSGLSSMRSSHKREERSSRPVATALRRDHHYNGPACNLGTPTFSGSRVRLVCRPRWTNSSDWLAGIALTLALRIWQSISLRSSSLSSSMADGSSQVIDLMVRLNLSEVRVSDDACSPPDRERQGPARGRHRPTESAATMQRHQHQPAQHAPQLYVCPAVCRL